MEQSDDGRWYRGIKLLSDISWCQSTTFNATTQIQINMAAWNHFIISVVLVEDTDAAAAGGVAGWGFCGCPQRSERQETWCCVAAADVCHPGASLCSGITCFLLRGDSSPLGVLRMCRLQPSKQSEKPPARQELT